MLILTYLPHIVEVLVKEVDDDCLARSLRQGLELNACLAAVAHHPVRSHAESGALSASVVQLDRLDVALDRCLTAAARRAMYRRHAEAREQRLASTVDHRNAISVGSGWLFGDVVLGQAQRGRRRDREGSAGVRQRDRL